MKKLQKWYKNVGKLCIFFTFFHFFTWVKKSEKKFTFHFLKVKSSLFENHQNQKVKSDTFHFHFFTFHFFDPANLVFAAEWVIKSNFDFEWVYKMARPIKFKSSFILNSKK